MAKLVRDTLEALTWEVLSHAAYTPDLAPSDYHLFAAMGHTLAEQRFGSYEDVNGSKQKGKIITSVILTNCSKDEENV